VCLSGDGGDELFAGYNRYLWADKLWQRFGKLPKSARRMAGQMVAGLPGSLRLHKASQFLQSESIEHGYEYLLTFWHDPQLGPTPSQGFRSVFRDVPDEVTAFIDRAMYVDQVGYLPGDNLCKVDRASMAVSLETRLPLLSHEIVELSWRVPLHMKVRDGSSKWLLRQVLYRQVPRELIDRPKMGFTVPLRQWLESDLRSWAEDTLATLGSAGSEFLDEKRVRAIWDRQMRGKEDNSSLIWSILMFLSWIEAND
jgi:asparagine synthase (glutamine-hydrolysing)